VKSLPPTRCRPSPRRSTGDSKWRRAKVTKPLSGSRVVMLIAGNLALVTCVE